MSRWRSGESGTTTFENDVRSAATTPSSWETDTRICLRWSPKGPFQMSPLDELVQVPFRFDKDLQGTAAQERMTLDQPLQLLYLPCRFERRPVALVKILDFV